jgi:hypothetical protein
MKYSELIKEVNSILSEYSMPLTLRQVYYRLVSKNLIPNTKTSYKGLSSQLVKARENGEVDDSKIEDRSRKVQGYGDYGYDNIQDFIDAQVTKFMKGWENFAMPMWEGQENYVLIALEKDSLSRLFVEVAKGFRVKVFATRGYGSYTFVKDVAKDLDPTKTNVILYFGDYDPSGRDIERDLGERAERYDTAESKFTIRRIAFTPEQIAQYKLPPVPEDAETLAKLNRDPRTKTYGMEYAVELDAIEPDNLQRLIRNSIVSQLDVEVWNARKDKVDEMQEEVRKKFENLKVTWGDETE